VSPLRRTLVLFSAMRLKGEELMVENICQFRNVGRGIQINDGDSELPHICPLVYLRIRQSQYTAAAGKFVELEISRAAKPANKKIAVAANCRSIILSAFLLLRRLVIPCKAPLYESVLSNGVDDTESCRSQFLSSVPSSYHNQYVPNVRELH